MVCVKSWVPRAPSYDAVRLASVPHGNTVERGVPVIPFRVPGGPRGAQVVQIDFKFAAVALYANRFMQLRAAPCSASPRGERGCSGASSLARAPLHARRRASWHISQRAARPRWRVTQKNTRRPRGATAFARPMEASKSEALCAQVARAIWWDSAERYEDARAAARQEITTRANMILPMQLWPRVLQRGAIPIDNLTACHMRALRNCTAHDDVFGLVRETQ